MHGASSLLSARWGEGWRSGGSSMAGGARSRHGQLSVSSGSEEEAPELTWDRPLHSSHSSSSGIHLLRGSQPSPASRGSQQTPGEDKHQHKHLLWGSQPSGEDRALATDKHKHQTSPVDADDNPATRLAELAPSNFKNQNSKTDSATLHGDQSAENDSVLSTVPSTLSCTREGQSSPRHARLPPSSQISFRQIEESDLEALQQLHEEIFPITYEMEFFLCVVHRKGILSWAACETGNPRNLIGFVTSRMMHSSEVEGASILQPTLFENRRSLMYILTLGVKKGFRHTGIASALVQRAVEHARRTPQCQGVFLHVVAYNVPAIRFYARLHFLCLRRVPAFYVLEGQLYDALIFVLCLNGGQLHSASFRDWALTSLHGFKQGFEYAFSYFGGKPGRPPSTNFDICRWNSFLDTVFSCLQFGSRPSVRPLTQNHVTQLLEG